MLQNPCYGEKLLLPAFSCASVKRHIGCLRRDAAIEALIATRPNAESPYQALSPVYSVASLAASTLCAECSKVGAISHRAMSALVGVTSFKHDSGQWRGKRRT